MKKYVIIPEFAPLYALRRRFGPQTGPVRKPMLLDVEVIKELLTQKPPVKVVEVKLTNAKLGTYSDTVVLTKANYNTANFSDEPVVTAQVVELKEPVASDSMGVDLRLNNDTDKVETVEPEEKKVEPVEETVVVEETETPAEESEPATGAADTTNEEARPMTRAERRALARERAEAAAKAATEENN